jgi:hypothetical protein
MQELRGFIDKHLPAEESQEVPNHVPLSPDLSLRSTPEPPSPLASRSPSPSR